MNENENHNATAYDDMLQTRELQILKTVVPYMNSTQQNQMIMLIQLLEFTHAYQFLQQGADSTVLAAAALPEGTDRRTAMLSDIRRFCQPKEQELIDNLINMFLLLDNRELFG